MSDEETKTTGDTRLAPLERVVRRGTRDHAYWLADKLPAYGDYGKEASDTLREQADRITRMEIALQGLGYWRAPCGCMVGDNNDMCNYHKNRPLE